MHLSSELQWLKMKTRCSIPVFPHYYWRGCVTHGWYCFLEPLPLVEQPSSSFPLSLSRLPPSPLCPKSACCYRTCAQQVGPSELSHLIYLFLSTDLFHVGHYPNCHELGIKFQIVKGMFSAEQNKWSKKFQPLLLLFSLPIAAGRMSKECVL